MMIEKDLLFLSSFFQSILNKTRDPGNKDTFRLKVKMDPTAGEAVRDEGFTQNTQAGRNWQPPDLSGTIRVQYVLTEEDCSFCFYSDRNDFLGQISLIQ